MPSRPPWFSTTPVDDAVDDKPEQVVAPSPYEAESDASKLNRKKDYLEGFLAQKPTGTPAGEAGGDLYEAVVDTLKSIYDPEIPVNIYDLGLIYGVEITPENHAIVTMTLTTPHCPGAESWPGEIELQVGRLGKPIVACFLTIPGHLHLSYFASFLVSLFAPRSGDQVVSVGVFGS